MEESVIVKVTIESFYFIEGHIIQDFGGVQEVIKEWFENHPLHQSHATRDYNKIGGLSRVVSADIDTEFDVPLVR